MIAIGADHGGFVLKEELIKSFEGELEFKDFGTMGTISVNYPDIAFKVAESVANGECEAGILICRSGIGMAICANKVKNIRCARVVNKEEAIETRLHQNANVIALSSKTPNIEEVLDSFINTKYIYEERHQRRIDQIKSYENME